MINIPIFPRFKPLHIEDKGKISSFLHNFEPYCDVQFWAMWHRNIDDNWYISQLHGHFIIKFTDHITGRELHTLIGSNDETSVVIIGLLKYLQTTTMKPQLSMVPEVTTKAINGKYSSYIRISEDRSNADYVFSVGKLVHLYGGEYKNKRSEVRRFWNLYPNAKVGELKLNSEEDRLKMHQILKRWARDKSRKDHVREVRTLERLLATRENQNDLFVMGLFLNEKLIGFTVNERFNDDWYNGYFGKADRKYKGAYAVLEQETAKYYFNKGCKYANLEQDLGLPGLRKNKMLWRPNKFLKKYSVYPKWGSGFDQLKLEIHAPQQ